MGVLLMCILPFAARSVGMRPTSLVAPPPFRIGFPIVLNTIKKLSTSYSRAAPQVAVSRSRLSAGMVLDLQHACMFRPYVIQAVDKLAYRKSTRLHSSN